jgi:hypothetical protein
VPTDFIALYQFSTGGDRSNDAGPSATPRVEALAFDRPFTVKQWFEA